MSSAGKSWAGLSLQLVQTGMRWGHLVQGHGSGHAAITKIVDVLHGKHVWRITCLASRQYMVARVPRTL